MPMIHLPFRGRANLRNHRKLLICDNQAAVLGGMNLASEYMGHQGPAGECWRDLSLLVQGPVVDHITRIFKWAYREHGETACAIAITNLLAFYPNLSYCAPTE